ncbi:hypothetical protein [Mucilaginibacter flavidus]|uniref:hypothetical protein n=1 Tax=Mucilaginibacter flavidus TaxID=2949309 RepID=UPI0020935DCD|nr:hypothetical protein [Mucilaginibacter flavidus]MCO5948244.1 hypothetical protein [Mucilaginibacter flavidus]
MVKLKDNPRLERFLAMLSLAVIALNFAICLIVMEVRKKDNSKDGTPKKEATKKFADSPALKKQHTGDGNKKDGVH